MTGQPASTSEWDAGLPAEAGLPLVSVLIERIADQHGLRTLTIKGPAAALQGLRPRRDSMDVDVLPHPDDLDALLAAMGQHGWRPVPVDDRLGIFPLHAVTMIHDSWPCTVDVHRWYPGMARDGRQAFDALWPAVDHVDLAHTPVRVPSPAHHRVLLLLTALREPWQHRHDTLLTSVELRWRSEREERRETFAAAEAMGALPALRPFFERTQPDDEPTPDWDAYGTPPREWLLITHTEHPGTLRLAQLVHAPWRLKVRMALAAVAPSADGLAYSAPSLSAEASPAEIRRARLNRLKKKLSQPRATFAEYRRLRRELRSHGYRS